MTKLPVDSPLAILVTNVTRRRDAIVTRLGGPAPYTPVGKRIILPPVGQRTCAGQLRMDES